jgi:hypothetical protein
MFRALLPESGQHKGSCSCSSRGCSKSTREGKPYCSVHIEESAYIRVILAELDRREAEEKILDRKRGSVSKDGFFVREGMLLLRTKDFTIKAFSRRLDISHHAAERLISMLVKWRLARRLKAGRGGATVSRVGGRDLEDGI